MISKKEKTKPPLSLNKVTQKPLTTTQQTISIHPMNLANSQKQTLLVDGNSIIKTLSISIKNSLMKL